MSSVARIKIEEIENPEHRLKYTVGIIGCNRIGILHACLFAEAGFKVLCGDSDQAIVNDLSKGRTPHLKNELEPLLRVRLKEGRLKVNSDLSLTAANSEIIIFAVPVTLNDKGKPDHSNLERALRQAAIGIRKGTLVIIAGIVKIGAIDGFVKDTLESVSGLRSGIDFFLAYSPITHPEDQNLNTLSNYRRVVAASDKQSLEIASKVLKTISRVDVVRTLDVRAAEVLTLFQSAYTHVRQGVSREFAIICEKMGVDYFAVNALIDPLLTLPLDRWNSNCEALRLLFDDADNLGVKLKILETVEESNNETLKHVFRLINEALKECGKTLRRAKISIIGASKTPNTVDIPKVIVKKLIELLESKGAKVSLYDPHLPGKPPAELRISTVKRSLTEALEHSDCIIIAVGHDQIKRLNLRKLKLMMKMPAAIVDLDGALDPLKVRAEGLVYKGFGRGMPVK
ncbi:MAG: UDP binding domain-containing protein [Candidatus Bathyarchaeia archaeon]